MKRLLFTIAIIAIVFPCTSHAQSFGVWHSGVTDTGDAFYAATINDSGNLLGQYCYPSKGNCIWLLGMRTACEEGAQYPVLANSDAGSSHINVYCSAKLDNGMYRYVFSEHDAIDKIITKGLKVGFAVPLQSDQFRVVRFDLNGSSRAITKMLNLVEKAQNKSSLKETGTRDQDL
ncbi:MAG: hypothetical protein K4571_18125 [Deltaproteobacteria bacterium]